MFTSVTNKQLKKAIAIYLGLTAFCILFTFIYEQFSYGESSSFMRLMFLAPFVGALLAFLSIWNLAWLHNKSALLTFNSAIAIAASACLVRGIIEVSGRSTTIDLPYWYACTAFGLLSLLCGIGVKKKTVSH